MKVLADGTKVVSRMYYYLLDFNDITDWDYIKNTLKKNALKELNKEEFIKLFNYACSVDVLALEINCSLNKYNLLDKG